MGNKNYLNEEKYQKNKKSVNKVGTVLLCCGALSLVAGIICIVLHNFIGGFLLVIGLACLGFGAQAKLLSHGREINAFFAQQQMPVVKEGIEKMAPSAGVAAKEIAKGIKEGLKDEEK